MPKLSLWNSGKKGYTYNYIDRSISEWVGISGTAVYCHLLEGVHAQGPDDTAAPSLTSIQDVLFLENRDRKYSSTVYELRGIYNVSDVDFDMKQFGFFMQNDTLFIEFHLNDMLAMLGRKLISGDVLELPHQRDDAPLNSETPAMNRFYVVEDVNRASDGYSPTWFPHLLRVKISPMTASQEFQDIMDQQALDPFGLNNGRLGDFMSTLGSEMGIDNSVVDAAKASVPRRNFQTQQFYVIPGDETTSQRPWILAGDGNPPNGAIPTGSGPGPFPESPQDGDYYLRTDYSPHTLFRYKNHTWTIQEQDYREADWSLARRLLREFIENSNVVTFEDGLTQAEKQNIYQAVKVRGDL